jgi:hypothetical protein
MAFAITGKRATRTHKPGSAEGWALFGDNNTLSVPSAQTAAMERATKEKHWRESQDVDAMLDPSRMLVKNVRGQARLAPTQFKQTCNNFRFGG